jgi:hypothetical protein
MTGTTSPNAPAVRTRSPWLALAVAVGMALLPGCAARGTPDPSGASGRGGPVTTSATPALPVPATTYRVAFVRPPDVLNVRSRPGVAAPVVATLDPGESGVVFTGEGRIGPGFRWVEVITPTGQRGWANRAYLAEEVDACGDPASRAAVDRFTASLASGVDDGAAQDLERGMVVTIGLENWVGTLRPLPLHRARLNEEDRLWGAEAPDLWRAVSTRELAEHAPSCNTEPHGQAMMAAPDPHLGDASFYVFEHPGTDANAHFDQVFWIVWVDRDERDGEWDVVGLTKMVRTL